MAENQAPVVLFVYNRPWHTEQTLQALEKNVLASETLLFIYADGPKNEATKEQIEKIQEVRSIITKNWNFKGIEIIEREDNWGLADNIVDGVTHIVKKYEKIIVLEDDIVTSVGFLKYMNDALNLYEKEDQVMHISGYMFPVKGKLPAIFFYNTASCWGWATWARAWGYYNNDAIELCNEIKKQGLVSKFDIENTYSFFEQLQANASGQLKTWAVKWYASFFIRGGFALHPYPTLTNNIGHDGNGENCQITDNFNWKNVASKILVRPIQIKESEKARQKMIKYNIGLYKRENKKGIKIKEFIIKKTPYFIIHLYRLYRDPIYRDSVNKNHEFTRLGNIPRYQPGTININGVNLKFVDSASFLFIYDELFNKQIYKFKANNNEPYIIDAGANIGLGIIYFKELYPNSKIVAFEPDENVFEALEHNIRALKITDVNLIKKALWNSETTLNFMAEGADGGRVAVKGDINKVVKVETVTLREYLHKKVDLLKIDIEGAEIAVLESCVDLLSNVDLMFIEYHSFVNKEQELHRLLFILTDAGFRYNIQQIGIFSPNPFIQINQSLGMDNQLNIFAYRV